MAVSDSEISEVSNIAVPEERPCVLVYSHSLLEGSMTFIKSQAEALTRYAPVYVGAHRVNGIELPRDRTYVLNERTPIGFAKEAVFRKWGWASSFVRKLKSRQPKILHAHFGTCGPAGMAIADGLQIPFVVTFHGQDATLNEAELRKSHRGREMLRKKKLVIEKAGAIIAVSDYIRRRMIDQGYPEELLVLHRNGINLEFFEPEESIQRLPILLFVGRFVEKKGAEYLIEAARMLHESGFDFELVMIGGGPLESDLKRAAGEARIPCRFLGFLPIEEVRCWLKKATIMAVPSVTASDGDCEGLPTNILEAQAMQTPVVATRHSGIPEGVHEGITAELVDERDAAGLAHSIRSFLDNPEKSRRFGEAGRRFVAENFDMRRQVAGLEDIFDEVRRRFDTR